MNRNEGAMLCPRVKIVVNGNTVNVLPALPSTSCQPRLDIYLGYNKSKHTVMFSGSGVCLESQLINFDFFPSESVVLEKGAGAEFWWE